MSFRPVCSCQIVASLESHTDFGELSVINLDCLWRKFQIFVAKHEYHSEDSKDAQVVLSDEDQPYLSDQAIKKSLKTGSSL